MSPHIQQSELVFERICLKMSISLNWLEFFSSFKFVCVHNSVNNAVLETFFIYEYLGCQVWPISKCREILFCTIPMQWLLMLEWRLTENRSFSKQLSVVHDIWHYLYVNCCFIGNIIFIRTWHQGCWWKTSWRKAFVKATWQFRAVKFHWLEQRVLHLEAGMTCFLFQEHSVGAFQCLQWLSEMW